jgi:hypothetical protein
MSLIIGTHGHRPFTTYSIDSHNLTFGQVGEVGCPDIYVEVKVTLRLKGRSVSQSVCLGVESTLGFVTGYYFLSESCCLVSMERPL